jgi:Ca2+-binding RTX toxin-like protein
MAAARAQGGSGCSGTLSTNPTIRQQQLICDPAEPLQGSMSVSYDPSQVTLRDTFSNDEQQSASIAAGPGYVIDEALVEVSRSGDVAGGTFTTLVPFGALSDTGGFETGYLQVKFHLTGTAGQIEPSGTVVDEAGVAGVDPFAVTFNEVEPGPILTIVDGGNLAAAAAAEVPPPDTTSYTIFAAGDNEHSGNAEDFFITNDGTNTRIGHEDISPATVSFTETPTGDQAFGARVLPDPGRPGQQALFGFGSDAPETIVVSTSGGGSKVTVTNNDTGDTQTFGPFNGFGRVVVYGRGGNDTIRTDGQGAQSVLFFGGDGNDTLIAGNGGSILSGGAGDDTLASGNGTDLLLGGRGTDTLNGGNGEDILVGEHTNFDEGTAHDVADLSRLFDEWSKGGKYEVRISHLTGAPGGSNGTAFFNLSGTDKNVWDDQADDVFNGGNGRDWIITGLTDATVAHDKTEIVSLAS